MKKTVLLLVALAGATHVSRAQTAQPDTSYWQKKTEVGANFNQASFSDNWQGGAVNNYGISGFFNAKSDYQRQLNTWTNDFQMLLGFQKIRGQQLRKSVDKLFFDSKYGRQFNPDSKWFFIANFNLLSQLANGYDFNDARVPRISGFLAPLYLTEALGVEWRPQPYFSLAIQPLAVRQTILFDKNLYQQIPADYTRFSNYGVERGRAVRNDIALAQLVANFDKDIAQNVNLKWRYQAFVHIKDLQKIDNRLDASLTAKINNNWNVKVDGILMYYQDQSFQVQWAQALGIGFMHTFKDTYRKKN